MSADPLVAAAAVALAGYVVGSIPVAGLVARRRAGLDLRDVGDGNPGYWNAKATLGRRAAAPVFVASASIAPLAPPLGRAGRPRPKGPANPGAAPPGPAAGWTGPCVSPTNRKADDPPRPLVIENDSGIAGMAQPLTSRDGTKPPDPAQP